jgi:hypothetical protein
MIITEEIRGIVHRHGAAAVMDDLVPLLAEKKDADVEQELLDAADFIVEFGTLHDVWDVDGTPSLHDMQHLDCDEEAAWALLGHWSIERGDHEGAEPPGFEAHMDECGTCKFLEGVLGLRGQYQYTDCPDCGLDLVDHLLGPGPFGEAQAWCPEPWTRRTDPLVGTSGDCGGDIQVSDSFNACWTAPLDDDTFAMLTTSFYLAEQDGRRFVQCETEYLHCRDLAAPGDTPIFCGYDYTEVEVDGDPNKTDLHKLAEQADDPQYGEWADHVPNTPEFLLLGGEQ